MATRGDGNPQGDHRTDAPILTPMAAERGGGIVPFAAGLVAAAIILTGLYLGQDILVPLALAILIAFALNPVVTWLVRRGLPRIAATGVAMTAVLMGIAAFSVLLGTQVRSLAADFPTYQETVQKKLTGLRDTMKAPGVFDHALQAFEGIEQQVAGVAGTAAKGPPPQKVEIVGAGPTPLDYAMTWLARAGSPLATTGIILLLAFLILLDQRDLRDRLLRLVGDDIHRSTDSMIEAGSRVSRYLLMQLAVNGSYGVPMGIGLWLIGVPGALLWGTVAAVMRFVPYVGPMISAIFPLALAFAVEDGWSMLLWTAGLIITLELISNNIIEPLLYGSSTGLSAISLIVSAMFWTAIWGPMGLVLSTPLTVCLLVIGRNVPQLRFLDILLGSSQVLDLSSRLYQRLIAGDVEEAIDIAEEAVEQSSPLRFYNDSGIAMLRIASEDYLRNATAEHRLRFSNGMDSLLDSLQASYPPEAASTPTPPILCLGGKWDIDAFAAEMTAHALALDGMQARALPAATLSASFFDGLDLSDNMVVVVSYFARDPSLAAKHVVKRLRMRNPHVHVVIAAWNAEDGITSAETAERIGATAIVASMEEALARVGQLVSRRRGTLDSETRAELAKPERVAAVQASPLLSTHLHEGLNALCKRAADIFDCSIALASLLDEREERFVGQSGQLPKSMLNEAGLLESVRHDGAPGAALAGTDEAIVATDVSRHPRLADNVLLQGLAARFYVAVPLRMKDGPLLGALAIVDEEPREFSGDDLVLLESMAADVLTMVGEEAADLPPLDGGDAESATIGQRLPD